MSQKPHLVTYHDLINIISVAKDNCSNQTLPMIISKRELLDRDPAHVAMIEAVISYLNNKGLLTNMVNMDHPEKR